MNGSDLSETKFINETFSFSRAILIDEKGVPLCQVNLVENPQFLPEFAEPGSSEALQQPLDLPECEEESLDIVAQYAEQAWIKKDVAFAPLPVITGTLAFVGGCVFGFLTNWNSSSNSALPAFLGGMYGGVNGIVASISPYIRGSGWVNFGMITMGHVGLGTTSGLVCSGIADLIFYE